MRTPNRRLRCRVVVLLLAGFAAASMACGSDAPSGPSALSLRPGRQILSLAGFSFSSDPRFPACTPLGVPRDGPQVDTLVNLTREGNEWVVRSTAMHGDLEIRLREVGQGGAVSLQGSARGLAIEADIFPFTRDVRVRLTGATENDSAEIDGATESSTSAFVAGRIAGTIRFSDSKGATGTCSAIQWTMQPF